MHGQGNAPLAPPPCPVPDGQGAHTLPRELIGPLPHLPVADEQLAAVVRWYVEPFGGRQPMPTDAPVLLVTGRQDHPCLPGGGA